MAIKKADAKKNNKTKSPTKAQISQVKKRELLKRIGEGLASTYNKDELDDITIELINNNADVKDTLLISFIDPTTGDTAEQWKLTLVKKTKLWEYGVDYLENDVAETFAGDEIAAAKEENKTIKINSSVGKSQ